MRELLHLSDEDWDKLPDIIGWPVYYRIKDSRTEFWPPLSPIDEEYIRGIWIDFGPKP